MPSTKDRETIRRLAAEAAQIAALPVQEEKRKLWRKLNGLKKTRPLVMVDQVCWNEMNVNDELTLVCEDADCRGYEKRLRRTLYQWKHFPVDMVVEPSFEIFKAVNMTGFGVGISEHTAATDPHNTVISHDYTNQFVTDADLDKIKAPVVTHDTKETARRMEVAADLFKGTLEIRSEGHDPYLSIWDRIAMWMSVEDALYSLVDKPDYMKEIVRRLVDANMKFLDQLEDLGVLCGQQSLIHCTGAYTDDLPPKDFNPAKPRTKDIWMFGLAQMLCTVSPGMFEEYEIDMCMPIFNRFGLVYYGCCDALDHKMAQVRKIRNCRKISMSPWANEENGAANIKGDYVFSRKPSPSMLAAETMDETLIRQHLQTSVDICQRYGCPLEIILKDLSTVRYEPQRLWRWAQIAKEVVGG
jgi:hypothetical protein